jgi:GTP-binding protein
MAEHNDKICEPIEQLVVDCPSECQNDVMSLISPRRAEIVRMDPKAGASDYIHMEFTIPARGLIGLRTRMLTATQGRAVIHHNLLHYEPMRGEVAKRSAGVIVSTHNGSVTAYSLDRLFDRGTFFVKPSDQIYEGQVVGEHCKDNTISVNLTINKKLTNVRSAANDDQTRVKPAREMSLEACLEYIAEDEYVEITPSSIRMRKVLLTESDRRREGRRAKSVIASV